MESKKKERCYRRREKNVGKKMTNYELHNERVHYGGATIQNDLGQTRVKESQSSDKNRGSSKANSPA